MKTQTSSLKFVVAGMVLAAASLFVLSASAMPGPGGHGGHGMMGGFGAMNPRMLDEVNATVEQRAQIRSILQAERDDMKALRESGRKLHQQGLELFAQPTVDARAAETLRQQMLAHHDQVSKRRLQSMLDISRVLSAEQRKKLADKMVRHGDMMERHMREREALDKPKS